MSDYSAGSETDFDMEDYDYDEDYMIGSDDDFEDIRDEVHTYDTPFKVLTVADLEARQKQKEEKVVRLLGVKSCEAAALLSAYKWHDDTLIERYVENPVNVLNSVGIVLHKNGEYRLDRVPRGFMCIICCEGVEEQPDMKTFALSCGHRLCSSCYGNYVTEKIIENGQSRHIRCFGLKCPLVVVEDAIKLLVSDDVYKRYRDLLTKCYVEEMSSLAWCPSPNCEYAIECSSRRSDLNVHTPSVKCLCGFEFCFGCGQENHRPNICVFAKMWIKKNNDDSETANWIFANTKDCPKCESQIEKNGGCNHMTCKKCRHQFCWMCLGDWSKHGSQYYNCSKYNEGEGLELENTKEATRRDLQRYLHFYDRFANHRHSLALESKTFARIQGKMKDLQKTRGMSWIEVQYLSQAFENLRDARRALSWAYSFAYYLKPSHITAIFEDNLRDLELAAENLSELFEKPTESLPDIKLQMLNRAAYVSQRRKILLDYVAKALEDGSPWQYTVEIAQA